MSKQTINVGATANDRKGDSLRTAFQKVNANFTELYSALGLLDDTTLSLGAFEFTGSTMTTTDSTAITIDQQVNVTSDLVMSGDIVPATDGLYNLGTLEKQWKSLHLLGSTIYFDGVPLSVSAGGTLYVNGEVAATPGGAATWDSVTGKPSMFDIGGNVIGIASSDTITEETIGGTISQTTTIESQIEIEASNIVIAKRITQVVDDGVVVSTDSTGSQFEVTDASISIKRYSEPDGPNNSSYFQIGASNGGAILEGVEENVGSNTFGRITVTQGVVSITASVEGNDKEWVFDFNGDVYVPTGSAIRGANDLSLVSSADGNSGVFVNGNSLVGTAVLYATNNAIITADYDGNRKDWNFDKSGTITVPLLLPKIFTAVLDEAHMVVPITLEGDPWQYGVEFAVNPDGSVQTQMDDPNPIVDPGYVQGSVFRFTEVDHGIPGYTFDITLNYAFDEQAEVFSTNPSVTSPPEYPSTIESTGAIKLTADTSNFVFGTDGSITFPSSAILDTSDSNIEFRGMNNFNVESLAAVNIITDAQGSGHSWTFNDDGSVTYPGDITQSSQDNTTCSAGVDTVVYTSTGLTRHAIKLFVMIEGLVDGSGNVETQACDVIAIKELNNDIIHVTTYGVTYTGASAIAEFDGQWNATTSRIEITCRPVSLTNSVTTSVHAIEMTSNN